MEIHELDWAAVEKAMAETRMGIEFGVTATVRIQTFQVDVNLCYARVKDKKHLGPWGFCDNERKPVTYQPVRLQKVLWLMLPDLLYAMVDEAAKLATEMEEATRWLSEAMAIYNRQEDERKDREEYESMVGLS